MNDRIEAVLASLSAAERPVAQAVINSVHEAYEHLVAVADEVNKVVQVADDQNGSVGTLAGLAFNDIYTALDELRDLMAANPLAMKAREKC